MSGMPRARRPSATFSFIGRAAILSQLRQLVSRPGLQVAWVSGIGGIGKSTLLRELEADLRRRRRRVAMVRLDLVEPSPRDVLRAICVELGVRSAASLRALLQRPERPIVMLDAFDAAPALEGWITSELVASAAAASWWWRPGTSPAASGSRRSWRRASGTCRSGRSASTRLARSCARVASPRRVGASSLTGPVGTRWRLRSPPMPSARPTCPPVLRLRRRCCATCLRACSNVGSHRGSAARWSAWRWCHRSPNPCSSGCWSATGPTWTRGEAFAWLRARPYVRALPAGLVVHDLVREAVAADAWWRAEERSLSVCASAVTYYGEQLHRAGARAREAAAPWRGCSASNLACGRPSWRPRTISTSTRFIRKTCHRSPSR
jgi:hypothetical protein